MESHKDLFCKRAIRIIFQLKYFSSTHLTFVEINFFDIFKIHDLQDAPFYIIQTIIMHFLKYFLSFY